MIVNNILINTLVLCFSCGCNNNQTGKVNYDGALCHQNAAKMIIDRNISFSDIIDDYTCDGNGNPLIYDLEPIKNIIRLQLNGGLPNHCDGNQKPPGLPFNISSPNPPMPEPPTEKPSTSKVIITIHLPNATNVKIIENKEDLKELANRQYEINPATKIHITLNGPDMVNDQNWQPNISKFINGIGTELNPTVTVNIDWSKIDINSDDFPQKIKKLVKQIAVMIKESKFSPDKFTIIAPGQSANLAGDIGHVYKRMYPGESLGKIIAVDPIVPEKWMNVHVLNKTDADAVIGLVTVKPPVEVSLKFVVKVNDLPEVQPWCKEGDCSKVTGVKILQEIIKQKWKWFTHKYPNGTMESTDILNSPYVFKYNPWIKDLNSYLLIVKENGATFETEFTPQDYGSWNSSHVLENDVAIIEFKDEVDKPTYHIFVFSANPDKDFSMTRTGNYAKEFYKISKNSYYWLIDWSRKYDKMQHASDEEKVRMIDEVVNTTWKSVDYSLHLDKTVLISIGASNDVVMKLAKNIKKKYRTVKVILGINSNKSGMKDLAETVINVHSYIPTLRLRMEQITQEGIQMIVNNPYRTQPDCQRFNYECSEIYGVAVVFKIIQAQLNNKPLTKNLAPREFLSGTELDEVLIELEKQKERTTFIVNTIPSVYVRGEAGVAGDWKGSLDGLDNTRKWIKDNPGGKIFVLIYNRAFLKWVYELEKTLPENSYIIRYDISVAYIANPDVTNITNESIFYQMAEDILTDIIERKIPSDQLTILSLVGDGASTIIAPLISRTLKHEINISTAKLILPFNPKHIPFDLEPEKTDANEVVAIYVPDILSCCNMDAGTININASTILTETCKEYGK
ncbi:uncharacterized protein LOC126740719 [Anthonomus grandis grandis]|uniref:uncharacterized protein LOC126740719 n=1 Tax=Anthonomus grandis grandis TaxID=2921223 RepID=UPI002165CC71|nr:uncharacterized protein LOC126740719 [Anthonomus grandis grandis]